MAEKIQDRKIALNIMRDNGMEQSAQIFLPAIFLSSERFSWRYLCPEHSGSLRAAF